MNKFIQQESIKIKKSYQDIENKRKLWKNSIEATIYNKFKEYEENCSRIKHYYTFHTTKHHIDTNENTIQISTGSNPIGWVVNTETGENLILKPKLKLASEKGCCLVASQCINGNISFIMYPFKSDRHSRKEDFFIIYNNISPEKISERIINNALRFFSLYTRTSNISSTSQPLSLKDNITMTHLQLKDIRNREKIKKTAITVVNDWGKIIVTIISTFFTTYYLTN